MIKIDLPQQEEIEIKNIVCDFNGTLAVSGIVSDETIALLTGLAQKKGVNIYVLTADTYGTVREQFSDSIIRVQLVSKLNGTTDKADFFRDLGAENCVAIGNGMNDLLMLKIAKLGICIIGKEGCSTKTLLESDIAVNSIEDAISLLADPLRIKATLRP